MSNAVSAPPAAGLAQAGCVVLAPSNAPLPDLAARWVDDHGLRTLLIHDPLQALTALCLLERAQLARSAWGLQRIEPITLLIVEPAQWPDSPRLIAAIRRHLPAVCIHESRGSEIVTTHAGAEPDVSAPLKNSGASRHVFSLEKGEPMPAAPASANRESFAPLHRPATAPVPAALQAPASRAVDFPRPAAARWPKDESADQPVETDPADSLRITRDEIAMLLDNHNGNGKP